MTVEVEYQQWVVDDLEQRVSPDGYHYVGLRLVPYEVETALTPTMSEVFTRGALADVPPGRVSVTLGHPPRDQRANGANIIGVLASTTDGPTHMRGEAKLANTPEAERARALIDVGALRQVSIGFRRQKGGTQSTQRPNGATLIRHHRVGLDHVALLRDGAYGDEAAVESVRDDVMRGAELADILRKHHLI
jgi:phage head maturation protease